MFESRQKSDRFVEDGSEETPSNWRTDVGLPIDTAVVDKELAEGAPREIRDVKVKKAKKKTSRNIPDSNDEDSK